MLRLLACSLTIIVFCSCNSKKPLFNNISSKESGIHFNNQVAETPEQNILNYEYLYNGGGVGIGDFNNDSLPDIYFTGNTVANKLYLNKGNMQFEDVTEAAGVNGQGKWCKGVSVVDINNDGLMDIYVCAAVLSAPDKRKNILYINKGINKATNKPFFEDQAEAYHLADNSSTQMAAFFDYDNDGDLDVYLLVNDLNGTYPNEFRPIRKDGSWSNTDKLLRNDWDSSGNHPVFTDISKQAGILIEGYGLGINICDINNDGWKDIYVSNDYLSNNLLYINNHDGTFTDRCSAYFKHNSRNAMGNDIADINNDGLPDVIELDMMPADHFRQKMMMSDISYQTFQNSARFGYIHQYVRNTLQINQGPALLEGDSVRHPIFSETGYFSGIAQTDWSWAPLFTDVDNDGFRDLIVSNGLPKDMSNLDFIAYREQAVAKTPLEEILKQVPTVLTTNYVFKNNGDITFTDMSQQWGFTTPTYSCGMATADFDRDGDLDIVINNTNMEASLLANTAADEKAANNHYINFTLAGSAFNKNGIGAVIRLFYKDNQQHYECTPYRGYMSSIENIAHFGLGNTTKIDSAIITWPGGKQQRLQNLSADQTININESNASLAGMSVTPTPYTNWFSNVTQTVNLGYYSLEMDFIDFNIQKLLLHKLTQYGPALASADINADGLEDIIAGGGSPTYAKLLLQNAQGNYIVRSFIDSSADFKYEDDGSICIFDVDNDTDPDIYISSGGCENGPGFSAYADRLYINDGKGNFTENKNAIPANFNPKSCVKAADYDGDGDLDLFVGGRVIPGSYPLPLSSIIYRNDSKPGEIKFTNVTTTVAPALMNIGMICDACWSDADNDGDPDLLLAGEWMPLVVLKNDQGKFTRISTAADNASGWWNSITAADMDNDGDMDYIAGNYGSNGYLQASQQYPLKVYGKDFDNNGSVDAVFSHWQRSAVTDTAVKEFPVAARDEMIKEMTVMKSSFPNYTLYAQADMNKILPEDKRKGATILSAVHLSSCWIENKGNMQFVMHDLPGPAQWAPLYGLAVDDFNGDGFMDIIAAGNEFTMAPYLGRNDALNGLVLQGNGKGNFKPLSLLQSGIYIPANGKALISTIRNNKLLLVASQNSSSLQAFSSRSAGSVLKVNADDVYAIIHLSNGQHRKAEFGFGSSFGSQSARFINLSSSVKSVDIFNRQKQKRSISN